MRCACVLDHDIDVFLFAFFWARNMESFERHGERLLQTWEAVYSVIVTWLCGMLECAWQRGLRFTPSICGWSSCRAQCFAGFWRHPLWQAQSRRDGLLFLWCGGPRVVLVEFFGGVVVLLSFCGAFLGLCSADVVVLWWFRWCEKLLWLGGVVVWRCCVCGGVSERSVGKGFVYKCWGRVW